MGSGNKISTVPAPVGGLNARDSLATMPETDAYILNNFWPQSYGVSIRKGFRKWASIAGGGEVGTLAPWSSVTGTQKLFAWSTGGLWDVTSSGNALVPILTGLTNDYWQYTNMSNAAGSHLLAFNGVDDGILYSEDGLHSLIAGNGTDPYTWSGLDPAEAAQTTVHQSRVWVTRVNSSSGYYLPLDAIYGVVEEFDFGPKFVKGGYLAFLATWTIDDGNGAEDHLVAVSSTGTAVVYGGIDPADAATWALVGVYNIGAPVLGRRSYAKVGGDLYILTSQGVVSMSGMLASTKVNDQKLSFPSDKIQFLLSELISKYGTLNNWQLNYVPDINMLICNVPTTVPVGNFQLAANQITYAWTQFSGMDATTWVVFNDNPLFGTYDGYVCLAWDGYVDNVGLDNLGGTSVVAYAAQAYSYLGSLGTQKQVGMYQPNFITSAPFAYNSDITYDFRDATTTPPDSLPIVDGFSIWDVGVWDGAFWAGGVESVRGWRQAQGMGIAASLTLATKSNGEVLWISTDYSYRIGGVL